MASFIPLVVEVGLGILAWFLNMKKEDREMQELFYKFVDKQHEEYLNSALMREKAKERLKVISEKEWVETTVV